MIIVTYPSLLSMNNLLKKTENMYMYCNVSSRLLHVQLLQSYCPLKVTIGMNNNSNDLI